jgi:hypothetical protein
MEAWVRNMVLFVGTSFDIRTARVRCQGELSPPPLVTRPPPGKPYFLEYCVMTCALVGVTSGSDVDVVSGPGVVSWGHADLSI